MSRSIHRGAAEDLAAAVGFYKSEAGARVARRFLNEFERTTRLIEEFPDIGTPTEDGRRWIPLTGFPYAVIYQGQEGVIKILVVRHQSRHPAYGESRK